MARQNQGFRKDLNLIENENDTQTLSNLAGAGIANDLRIIQNNLRNISTIGYSSLSSGFFFFGSDNRFVYTNDDVVTVSENVTVGVNTLYSDQDYYVCNSDGKTKFKLSTIPSSSGINTINVVSVSSTNFNFIRKDPVTQQNIVNFLRPELQDINNFSYSSGGSINSTIDAIQVVNDETSFTINSKYKKNADNIADVDITVEGTVIINDPAKLNTNAAALSNAKSPGIFIGDIRAFSTSNNPWTKVGTALSTLSSLVSVSEFEFSGDISISGISTQSDSQIAVTSFSHKFPVIINGETYYLLLST